MEASWPTSREIPSRRGFERIDASGQRQLTNVDEGIDEVVVAGSGQVGFAASFSSRLLKFDLVDMETVELFQPVPSISSPGQPLVPGSAATIQGITGVTQSALLGLTVSVKGKPVPLLRSSTSEITYQLPWDADPQHQASVEIGFAPSNNPFDPLSVALPATVSYFAPMFQNIQPLGTLRLSAWHADGNRVAPERPASEGETLTVYMSGLGSVAPSVGTGVEASADPLSLTGNTIACVLGGTSGNVQATQVSYAGLAPGQIGIYQVNFQLPAMLDAPFIYDAHGYLRFSCGLSWLNTTGLYDALFIQ